jgi:hypothetical protein
MSVVDMEDMDKRIAAMNRRLAIKEEQEAQQPRPQEAPQKMDIDSLPPYTRQMMMAFQDWTGNRKHSAKCPSCKWQATITRGKPLVVTMNIPVMREMLVCPFVICKNCGLLFLPNFAKQIVNQATKAEEQLMAMQEGESDGA